MSSEPGPGWFASVELGGFGIWRGLGGNSNGEDHLAQMRDSPLLGEISVERPLILVSHLS